MSDLILRSAREGDIADFAEIWSLSFGDSPEFAEKLISDCVPPENIILAELGEKVQSGMLAFDDIYFGGRRCSYLYALCTHPRSRGLGLGSAVLELSAKRAFERGAETVLLRPSDSSLALWYEKRFGFRCLYRGENARLDFSPCPRGEDPVQVSAEEYSLLRSGAEKTGLKLLKAQEIISSFYGGAFVKLGESCFCVEKSAGSLLIREAICPKSRLSSAAAALASYFGAERVSIRQRALEGEDSLSYLSLDGAAPQISSTRLFPFTLE